MKVGFGSSDWSPSVKDANGHPAWGGSGYVRLGQYADLLSHDVVVGALCWRNGLFGVADWYGNHHFDCDVLVLQRVMFEDVAAKMGAAKAAGQVLVNDVDDWYWGLSPTNGAFAASHPGRNADENVNHYRSVVARSSLVTTSTPYLRDRLSRFVDCDIEVLTNCVRTDTFPERPDSGSDVPLVGWVGSTAHRSGDLEILQGILQPMVEQGRIRLHHSGHVPQHPSFAEKVGVAPEAVSTLPMARPEDYPQLLTMDVGLAPLSDMAFNRAKSAIKLLEYSAAGVPAVVSKLDAYEDCHNDYGLGRLARRPKDWIRHIDALCDPEVRAAEGRLARERVQACDTKFGAKRLDDLLATLA